MSNQIDRSTIELGAGIIDNGTAISYSRGGIKLEIDVKTAEMINDLGAREDVLDDVDVRVVYTPSDEIDSTLLAFYYPYGATALGTEVFGGTDTPLTIWIPSTGKKYVISAYAVQDQPEWDGSAKGKNFGSMTLRGLPANNTARSAANSTLTISTAAYAGRAYDRTKLFSGPWTATWGGSSPWSAMLTGAPWKFKPKTKWTELYIEGHGIVGMVLDENTCDVDIAKLRNVTGAQMLAQLAIQGTGNAQGTSRFGAAQNLVLDAGTGKPIITVNKTNVRQKSTFSFTRSDPRFQDALTFTAQRAFGSDALYTIAATH